MRPPVGPSDGRHPLQHHVGDYVAALRRNRGVPSLAASYGFQPVAAMMAQTLIVRVSGCASSRMAS